MAPPELTHDLALEIQEPWEGSKSRVPCVLSGIGAAMTTTNERINNMFANSSTWRSKEEELKGRAAIHASQVNRYSAANARAFAGSTVSQEDLEKEREASQKRKAAEANELAQLLEEQKADVSKGQKLAFPLGKVEKKVEKKMPVLSVKKPRTEVSKEAEAETAETAETKAEKSAEAETKEPEAEAAGAAGIGLAYSDSESES
eukprot:Skav218897  [mRNA]  locus=scaffold328:285191:286477:+ [translate_table: standard]